MGGRKVQGGLVDEHLSYAVIGCAQRVHAALGSGSPESAYQRASALELMKSNVPFQSQAELEVCYDDAVCGRFRVDILVQGRMVPELKAAEKLCKVHEAQILAYLKASGIPVGLLMNFGQPSLAVKRFAN